MTSLRWTAIQCGTVAVPTEADQAAERERLKHHMPGSGLDPVTVRTQVLRRRGWRYVRRVPGPCLDLCPDCAD